MKIDTLICYVCFCLALLAWAYKHSQCEKLQQELLAEKAAKQDFPAEWEDTKVMFHILASENYQLNGQAKRFLPKGLVIPKEELEVLTRNGWTRTPNGAIPK